MKIEKEGVGCLRKASPQVMRFLILYLVFEVPGLGRVEEIDSAGGKKLAVRFLKLKDLNFALIAVAIWFAGLFAANIAFYFNPVSALLISSVSALVALAIGIVQGKDLLGKIIILICVLNLVGIAFFIADRMAG